MSAPKTELTLQESTEALNRLAKLVGIDTEEQWLVDDLEQRVKAHVENPRYIVFDNDPDEARGRGTTVTSIKVENVGGVIRSLRRERDDARAAEKEAEAKAADQFADAQAAHARAARLEEALRAITQDAEPAPRGRVARNVSLVRSSLIADAVVALAPESHATPRLVSLEAVEKVLREYFSASNWASAKVSALVAKLAGGEPR